MGECAPAAAAPTTAKTSVWWDIDKCAVPRGRCDPHRIAHNLIAALAAAGYVGPVSIAAYGDAARVPPPVLAALSATGICLNHVPAGSKDTSEKRMLVDMLFWAFDNPPPGNYLLISGDQDLSDLLHRLRMKRYDILLVRPPNASSLALAAAAKKVWLWENLTSRELLLPEPPPARSVLGCKLDVNSSGTLSLGCKLNTNNSDTLNCSQSKACSEYGKGDSNGNTGNQNRVKPIQKPPARSVLGCKLDMNSSGALSLGCKLNTNNSDTLNCSQSNVCSEYGKGDSNGKTGNQNRVKPIQKYVKKANSSSTPGINQDRVGPAGGVSESYAGNRSSEIDHSSTSSLSSSNSDSLECAKVDTSVPQETPTSSKLPSQKSVSSTHSQQVEAAHRSVPGEKPSTSTKWVPKSATLDLDSSNGHYNRTSQHLRYSEAQNKVHSEFTTGSNKGEAVNRPGVKPLQKYVKKKKVASGSANKQSSSVGVHDRPIGNSTIEVDQTSASSSSSTSTLCHSSAQKPVASAHLHQAKAPHESIIGKKPRAPVEQVKAHESILGKPSTSAEQVRVSHESILGKKPSTSVEHASRIGTHDFDVKYVNYHPGCQQSQSSEAQNKLHCYSNMAGSSRKKGNDHKLNKGQINVRWVNVSPASAKINPSVPLDITKGSTLSYSTQSLAATSSSRSLESAKVNDSSPLLSAHKSLVTDHLHQDGAASIFGNKSSTSFQCTAKNETFVFGVSSSQYHPTYKQDHSSLLPEQHNSGTYPHIDSHSGNSATQSVEHNGVSSAQTWSCGPTFDGLDYICNGFSRLNISECPRGTTETRPPFQGAPTNDPSMEMPDISGPRSGFDQSISSFHLGFNTSSYLNQSTDPQTSQPPCGNTCRAGHQISAPNSPEIEGTVGIILHALGTLKTEKILPTESNIADCICYGEMNLTGFDVKKALELAIRDEAVVMKKLLHDMPLFVAKDESLWKCVNVTNSKAKNPIEELETVHKYISSSDGYSTIKNSQSRYQAATILKRSCLQHCALGDILQVLHIINVRKKWIVPHSSGWQPLSMNTAVDTTDATGKVKS